MASESTGEQFNAIVKKYKESTLDGCSEDELRQYHTFLLERGAVGGFNETTYYQLCDHIRTLLLHRETQNKLEELKEPHWTTRAGFWVGLVTMIIASIAAYFTVFPRSSHP
jgi:hypothetical protein